MNKKLIAKQKGERLQRLRKIANLSRKQLTKQASVNINTLRGWENGLATGLSRVGADKILKAVEKEGVICSAKWLMQGEGNGPRIIDKVDLIPAENSDDKTSFPLDQENEEKRIIKELQFFRTNNANAVDLIVMDDGMLPCYKKGDYIAGIKQQGKHIQSLIDYDCIIQTEEGHILFRHLRPGKEKNTYNLICTNINTTQPVPIIYNTKLLSAAKVIWIRRQNKF